eukprot:4716339-Ditylum_brightwellii.AAC.1
MGYGISRTTHQSPLVTMVKTPTTPPKTKLPRRSATTCLTQSPTSPHQNTHTGLFSHVQMLFGDAVLVTVTTANLRPAFMHSLYQKRHLLAENGIPFILFGALIDDEGNEVVVGKNKYPTKGIICALDVDDDDDDNKDKRKDKAIEIAKQIGDLYLKTTKPSPGAKPFLFQIGRVEQDEKFINEVVIDSDASLAVAMMYHDDLKCGTFDGELAEQVIEHYFVPSATTSTNSLSRKSAIQFQYDNWVTPFV